MVSGYRNCPEIVLQFGEGNFLRCFVDWMFHRLNRKGSFDGSVVAVQPIERGMVNLLNEQEGLYTIYLRGLQNGKAESKHELIDVISRGINLYEDFSAYLQTAGNPEMRYVVSNTPKPVLHTAKRINTLKIATNTELVMKKPHRISYNAGPLVE